MVIMIVVLFICFFPSSLSQHNQQVKRAIVAEVLDSPLCKESEDTIRGRCCVCKFVTISMPCCVYSEGIWWSGVCVCVCLYVYLLIRHVLIQVLFRENMKV